MTTLLLTEDLLQRIQAHAIQEYPYECCGFLLGTLQNGLAEALEYLPATNQKPDERERRFLIDPQAYQEAEDRADQKDLSLISIVHSHPDHPDQPSEFDRTHAWPGISYLILAVQRGQVVGQRSWQLKDDRSAFVQETLKIL